MHRFDFSIPRCGVCATPLGGPLVTCPDCELSYHDDCWAFYRGCALYGCRRPEDEGKAALAKELPPDRRRGTVALICQAAFFAMAAGAEKHTGCCCHDGSHESIAFNVLAMILLLLSAFFGLAGFAMDRPRGRAIAALIFPGLIVVLGAITR